jgi:hypothetical protein
LQGGGGSGAEVVEQACIKSMENQISSHQFCKFACKYFIPCHRTLILVSKLTVNIAEQFPI